MDKKEHVDNLVQERTTLLGVFDHDLNQLQQRVGIDRKASTYRRQQQIRQAVAEFINEVLHLQDVPLKELTASFIRDFSVWLSTHRHYRAGTIWLVCQSLKSTVSRAYQHGLMPSNPFYSFHIKKYIRPRQYQKHITFHCARHTFAVTALNAGLPVESISRVLGHSNIATTQIYAKITLNKLNRDMDSLDRYVQEKLELTSL